jgi:hypothetical protein
MSINLLTRTIKFNKNGRRVSDTITNHITGETYPTSKRKIIHLLARDGKYTCNVAVTPTPAKSTGEPSKMTCKNCERIYMKYWSSPEYRTKIEEKRNRK